MDRGEERARTRAVFRARTNRQVENRVACASRRTLGAFREKSSRCRSAGREREVVARTCRGRRTRHGTIRRHGRGGSGRDQGGAVSSPGVGVPATKKKRAAHEKNLVATSVARSERRPPSPPALATCPRPAVAGALAPALPERAGRSPFHSDVPLDARKSDRRLLVEKRVRDARRAQLLVVASHVCSRSREIASTAPARPDDATGEVFFDAQMRIRRVAIHRHERPHPAQGHDERSSSASLEPPFRLFVCRNVSALPDHRRQAP